MVRKAILIVSMLLLPSLSWATDYTQDANCQMAWLMNTSESPLSDASGHSKTGTLSATAPTYYATGKFGGCYNFTNSADYVYSPTGVISGQTSLTFMAWINTTQTGDNHHIFNIGTFDANGAALILMNTGAFKYGPVGATPTTAGSGYNNGVWHHVAVVYDKTLPSGNWRIYVDGNMDSTQYNQTTFNMNDTAEYVGAYRASPTSSTYNYNGQLDDVAIFNRALSQTEINDTMVNGLGTGSAPPATIDDSQLILVN